MSKQPPPKDDDDDAAPSRREVLGAAGGAAAGLLAACGMPQDICKVTNCVDGGDGGRDMTGVPECAVDSFTVPDIDSIAVGQFRVIANEETFILRDANGFAIMWNRCRHAGCILNYNAGGKTLDCPCHGSQYRLDGTVIRGPAIDSLAFRSSCRVNGVMTISRANQVKGTPRVK